MSLSVMSPLASSRTLILTSSVPSWSSACVIAPSDPDTSALRMIRSSLAWPAWIWRYRSSRVARPGPAPSRAACSFLRRLDHGRVRSSRRSPRAGRRPPRARRARPRTTTADAGPAFGTRLPAAFSRARTLPKVLPTTTMSPTRSVPVWTISVATGPRPLSSCASITVPTASRFGLALSSWRSATSRMISSSSSMPSRVFALTGTSGVSPP